VQREFVTIGVECSKGHRVGLVFRSLIDDGGNPFGLGHGLTFVDPTPEDRDSGKVKGRCEVCMADVQMRWVRVRAGLERLVVEGRTSDVLRASSED
jgi:hypothetical protein